MARVAADAPIGYCRGSVTVARVAADALECYCNSFAAGRVATPAAQPWLGQIEGTA